MREIFTQSILADSAIVALVSDRFYESSTLGVGDVPANPELPYIAYQEFPSAVFSEVRETSKAQLRTFQFFVYDERGSYTRIGAILKLLRQNLDGLVGLSGPGGTRCIDASFRGESGDLTDTQKSNNIKFLTFQFLSHT